MSKRFEGQFCDRQGGVKSARWKNLGTDLNGRALIRPNLARAWGLQCLRSWIHSVA